MPLPIVISYYTKNTLYEKEALDLIASCKDLNLKHFIEPVENLGSWEKNCCMKPSFILSHLQKLKAPILWVDADAVIVNPLSYFSKLKCDIAFRRKMKDDVYEVLSGTLFVNYTQKAIDLLKTWQAECQYQLDNRKENVEVWDQKCLKEVLNKKKIKGIKTHYLPMEYCFIYGELLRGLDSKKIAILHFQASRLSKDFVSSQAQEPSFLQNMSPLEMKLMRLAYQIQGFLSENEK
jgi:hypothetical protein